MGPEQLLASADHAAGAALRELPEALVIVFDRQLRFVLTAGQAIERMGDPEICREGNFVADAFPAEFWERFEPLFSSALEGETRTREIWTAEERHCLMVDAGPLCSDGGPAAEDLSNVDGGIAVVLDITARRQADMMIPHRTEGFEEVFEHAPIGTGLLDTEGRWLLVNRALCEITGYTSDELIGKRFDGIMHPEDAGNDAAERRRLAAGEIPAFQVEKRYFDAAGETVSAILSMSLVRDRDGRAAPLHRAAPGHLRAQGARGAAAAPGRPRPADGTAQPAAVRTRPAPADRPLPPLRRDGGADGDRPRRLPRAERPPRHAPSATRR